MRKPVLILLVALVAPEILPGTSAQTSPYLVATRRPARETRLRFLRDVELVAERQVEAFESVEGFAAELTETEVAELKKSPEVLFVEDDVPRSILGVATAETIVPFAQTSPYGVGLVNAPGIWPVTRGRSLDPAIPIRIVVIDTGIAHGHPDLAAAYRGGWNVLTGSDDPLDDNGHGTHVAGTIAALDDGAGVVGVAPEIELYAVKVLDRCGNGRSSSIILALDWIIKKKKEIGGNWIASLSLGQASSSILEEQAFQRAADEGILTIAAAGNEYDTDPREVIGFPAAYRSVLAVGATDSESKVAAFSQRGAELALVAPGVGVLSTVVAGQVALGDGRSFSSSQYSIQDEEGEDRCLPAELVTGGFVSCGTGGAGEFPGAVRGKIALVQRGGIGSDGERMTFGEKAKNAKIAGAIALIIYNDAAGLFSNGTLGHVATGEVVYTVAISREDGQELKKSPDAVLSLSYGAHSYGSMSGTSMSTPHVAAVAGLVWALAPGVSHAVVREALSSTAADLGQPGFDTTFGYGLVDAYGAALRVAPHRFGAGATPSPDPVPAGPRRRAVKR